tara:strand:- start:1026 stop:2009 length:984 start_codon:yes stop_codon:yes gene_type:complete
MAMNTFTRTLLVTAIAATSFSASADLKPLNDGAMGDVTGQAGVTIDLSANVEVKEIAYQDKGFLVIDGLKLGGHSTAGATTALDDIRLTIDVAGTAADDLGNGGVFAGDYVAAALATDPATGAQDSAQLAANAAAVDGVETSQAVTDGDLVISLRSQSGAPVDYGLGIGSISLAKEADNAANIGNLSAMNADSTVLVSAMQIDGYLGPVDLIVQEEANSLNINAYFNATGAVTLPFMGTSLGFELHNRRGDSVIANSAGTMSFAHAQVDVSVKEDHFGAGQNALAVNVQDFSGDLDLTNITMGNGASIGSLYMTDVAVTAETVIYGH